jgi:hypothetical protein
MIKIYVIYHSQLEDTNVFTTNKDEITDIIKSLMEKYPDTKFEEWSVRKLKEGKEFCADMGCF